MAGTRVVNLVLLAFIPLLLWPKLSYGLEIFDPMDYEALGDGVSDDAQALMDAWDAACQNRKPSALLIAKGTTYLAGPMSFEGPCYNHAAPKIIIDGTLKSIESLKDFGRKAGWLEIKRVDKLEISGQGVLDGQGAKSWSGQACGKKSPCYKRPTSLRLLFAYNTVIRGITIKDSKGFQMSLQQCKGVTVRDMKIIAPDHSPNTDGIHISRSMNTLLDNLQIGTGDDCVSLGQGVVNLTVSRVHCGPGHGISVGSLGKYPNEEDLNSIHVKNCTLKNTDNGLRIKTWGGSPPSAASNIVFEDILMTNVSNPIIVDQEYCPDHSCKTNAPSRVKLDNLVYKNIRGTSRDPTAVSIVCSKSFPCKNVLLEDIDLKYVDESGEASDAKSECTNISQGKVAGKQNPSACSDFELFQV